MKFTILFATTLVILATASQLGNVREQFDAWRAKYERNYDTAEEYEKRLGIFAQNLAIIKDQNERSRAARFGANKFADLSTEEFRQQYLSPFPFERTGDEQELELDLPQDIPSSFDWVSKGAVTGVKNQGQCGSCWSFSTTGNVEGQHFLATGNLVGLSEQNLVDCSHNCIEYDSYNSCNAGCDGGLQPAAFEYIMQNGIDTESSYPYLGVDSKCDFKSSNVGANIGNYTMISTNETVIAQALVDIGPLSIAAYAETWQFYVGGIFDLTDTCSADATLDHGILITGYGTDDLLGFDIPYWDIKNSWGADWGESGYLKIRRDVCACGLCRYVSTSLDASFAA